MMNEPSVLLQFIPLIVLLGILVYPVSRILRRIGYSPWLSLLVLIPGVGFIGLWIVAFVRWPAIDRKVADVFAD